MDKQEKIIAWICIFALLLIGGFGFILIANSINKRYTINYHVHFIDTNQCYNVEYAECYKGVAFITFEDKSKVECSASNVVIYKDHTCEYCGK